jgi:hypothetical protein
MAILRIYKRKSADMDLSKLVEAVSESGLEEGLQKFYDKPLEKETKSIVAGPSFLQFLSKLFRIQISGGDVIQFEHKSHSKYYMLSATGT